MSHSPYIRDFTVLIHRDYSHGQRIKFDTAIPSALKHYISAQIFYETITDINEIFEEAEDGTFCAYCEGFIGSITGNIQYYLFGTQFDRKLDELIEYIDFINRKIYHLRGLDIENPKYRGFRELGITTL